MAAQGGTDPLRKARVNTMLHLAPDNLNRFNPGNLYVCRKDRKPSYMPSLKQVLRDCLDGSTVRQVENMKLILEHAHLIALEITPACDYAQNKMGLSRLIAGFVLPHEDKSLIKRPQFLKASGPFLLKSKALPSGAYDVYLNSRYPVSAKLEEIRKQKPIARLRSQLLADVQSWAGYQGSRQGVMLLQ